MRKTASPEHFVIGLVSNNMFVVYNETYDVFELYKYYKNIRYRGSCMTIPYKK